MKTVSFLLIFVIATFGLINLAFGSGMRLPHDYQIEVDDAKYVFVMLATGEYGQQKKEIRSLYKLSGLYLKSDPREPFWTIDWYAYAVYVSSDGKHLVRMGRGNHGYGFALATAFYNEGKLVKEYLIKQLVADPLSLPTSTAGVHWIGKVEFDDHKKILKLKTRSNEKYVFNIKTGAMIEGKEVIPVKPENDIQKLINGGKMVQLAKLGKAARDELYKVLSEAKTGLGIKQGTALCALMLGGRDSFPYFERLLKHPNENIRTMALFGLKEMSCNAAKPLFKQMLNDKSASIRTQAIAALLALQDKTVLSAAIKILEKGDKKQVQNLIHGIRKSRIDSIVPHMINVTRRIPSYEINNAEYWLNMTTCFPFAGEWVPDKAERWWSENKSKSLNERYIIGIDRCLVLLEDENKQVRQEAFTHLRFLTGLRFGDPGGVYESSGLPQWKKWRKSIQGKRPGEIIIEATPELMNDISYFYGIYGFSNNRDVGLLLDLYQSKNTKKHEKMRIQTYAESELRRITGIDSYGCYTVKGEREKEVIKKWKEFADTNK